MTDEPVYITALAKPGLLTSNQRTVYTCHKHWHRSQYLYYLGNPFLSQEISTEFQVEGSAINVGTLSN